MENFENNLDTSHIVAGQEALSRRLSMIEDGAWAEWDVIKREQQQVTEVYQTKLKLDQREAQIERLTNSGR